MLPYQEVDGLNHQCPLGTSKFELLAIVTLERSVHGDTHEVRYDLVEPSSEDGVIICLGQSLVLDVLLPGLS